MSELYVHFPKELQKKMGDIVASIDFSYMIKDLLEAIRPMAKMAASIDLSYATKDWSSAMRPLLESNQRLFASMFTDMTDITLSVASIVNSSAYKQNITKNISAALSDFAKKIDFSIYEDIISQVAAQLEGNGYDGNYDIDDEQRSEFEDDLTYITDDNNRLNWYENLNAVIRKWFDKNFLLALLLVNVFLPLLLNHCYTLQVKPQQAVMRELPNIKAEVIIRIEQHQIISVIDSQNHWINVVYFNPGDGQFYEGWLSKRSCMEMGIDEQGELEKNEDFIELSDVEEIKSIDERENMEITIHD